MIETKMAPKVYLKQKLPEIKHEFFINLSFGKDYRTDRTNCSNE
jgi:hypothetical protein